jgi:3-oxoacyl-[acyl-carrier protein] reductase
MRRLDDQTVVVTGASRGIGREIAVRCASEGAAVALVSRDRDRLERVASEVGGETVVAPADVTREADVERAVESAVEAFGRIDTLVNNAGTGLLTLEDERKVATEVTEAEWDTVVDTNLKGAFLFAKHAVPRMTGDRGGHVINISSGWGKTAAPGLSPYVSSKWGLEGLTRALAEDFEGDGVAVNAVDPGGRVDTAFWDHLPDAERDELLDPSVVNDAVVELAARAAAGPTGESLTASAWVTRLG